MAPRTRKLTRISGWLWQILGTLILILGFVFEILMLFHLLMINWVVGILTISRLIHLMTLWMRLEWWI
jgi:hypothetical protein